MSKREPRPITDFSPRPFPQLGWVYDRNDSTGRGPMHIADQNCKQDGDFRSFTRCKKAVRFHHYIDNGMCKVKPELEGFRLCRGCGTQVEFAEALEVHKIGYAKQLQEYRDRRAAERAQQDIETAEREARVDRLKRVLNVGGFIEDRHYLIAFSHEGFKYTINENGRIE